MFSYDAFIQQTTHFQPRLVLKIGGEDVTDRLIEDHSVVTDALLDTPTLNVYTTARVNFSLDNSDNAFNTKNSDNFFTNLDPVRPADGWQTPAEISVVFEGDPNAPTDAKIFFVGYVEQITELPEPRWVSVLLLEQSGLLQQAVVENFGRPVNATIGGQRSNPDFSSVNPFFNLPPDSVPVSRDSLTAQLSGIALTVLPTLPRSGRALSARHVAVNENRGQLHFGAEPERGVSAFVNVIFKTAYRYRAPEALVSKLLDASGVYSEHTADEKLFAESLIESPILEHTSSQFSSHGRPQVGTVAPVMRWIRSDLSGFYMAGSRSLFRYRRRNDVIGVSDEWELISDCPDFDAAILQFEKVGDDFYVLTVRTWEGVAAKLWKVTAGTDWVEISGASATATHFFDYFRQSDPAADNRKTFVVHRDQSNVDYLYYIFNSGTAYGVRRVRLSDDAVSTVFTQSITSEIPASTPYGVNFVISFTTLYAFVCQRPRDADAHLRVFSMGLDGSGQTEFFVESWEDSNSGRKEGHPAMVTDVVERGGDLYFVLTFQSSLVGSARAELSKLDVSELRRYVLKTYDNSRYAARSLVVHREGSEDNIYFVEGTYLSGIKETTGGIRIEYPTHEDTGHLGRIDVYDMLVDYGGVWESFRDPSGTGIGLHTAFCSNLHRNELDDTLHLISGYGLLSDSAQETQQSQRDFVNVGIDNWVWLQFGKKLATKIPIFPTNDRTVWSLLEELARVVDFEIGFTSGQDEIVEFVALYPHLNLEPRGYLFFRTRGSQTAEFAVDESSVVDVSSGLDTTLIFNHISMPYGDGVWIAKDRAERFRSLPLPNSVLTDNEGVWAELITTTYLARQKRPRLKTRVLMKFAPQLALGQILRITSEYHSLRDNEFRVTAIGHDLNSYQTELEMREDSVELFLPPIEDFRYIVGDTVSGIFPEATGPGGIVFTYEMRGLPPGFNFDSATRERTGTLTAVGEYEVVYTATTDETPSESVSVEFNVVVEENPGSLDFGDAMIPSYVHRVDCQITPVSLPRGEGGVKPLRYVLTGLPDGYVFDSIDLSIGGEPETEGTTAMGYDVYDFSGDTERLSFYLMREKEPQWVGFGYIGEKSVWLDVTRIGGIPVNEGRVYTDLGRDVAQDIMGNSIPFNIDLGTGTYVDADGDGTFFMALERPTRQLRLWNVEGVLQTTIQLPVGNWIACAMTPTRRYVLNTTGEEGLCIHGYSNMGTELVAERILLDFNADYESMAVHNGIVYVLVSGTNTILAWSLSTKTLSESHFKELPKGSTDYVGITVSDGSLYAIRANSEDPLVVDL